MIPLGGFKTRRIPPTAGSFPAGCYLNKVKVKEAPTILCIGWPGMFIKNYHPIVSARKELASLGRNPQGKDTRQINNGGFSKLHSRHKDFMPKMLTSGYLRANKGVRINILLDPSVNAKNDDKREGNPHQVQTQRTRKSGFQNLRSKLKGSTKVRVKYGYFDGFRTWAIKSNLPHQF